MRTADRTPKRNYLASTLNDLVSKGVPPERIHVFATDNDVRWMPDGPPVNLHVPAGRRTPNQNGVAPIDLLETVPADWIILSEDDLEWCEDPLGSMARWLQDHARPDVLVYRFFAFDPLPRMGPACEVPLREQKGSQVIALRAADALRFAEWARAHPKDWRPRGAPFQQQPESGFDKLVGYWALQDRPSVTVGLVSRPFFVRHIGLESSLHRCGITRDGTFSPHPYGRVPACA
jgi:hypothetical protein